MITTFIRNLTWIWLYKTFPVKVALIPQNWVKTNGQRVTCVGFSYPVHLTILIYKAEFSQETWVCLLWKCLSCHLCFEQVMTVNWDLLTGTQCHPETIWKYWLEDELRRSETRMTISSGLLRQWSQSMCKASRTHKSSPHAPPHPPTPQKIKLYK